MHARLMAFAAFAMGTLAATPAWAGVETVTFSGTFNQFKPDCAGVSQATCVATAISTPFSGTFSYATGNAHLITGAVMTSDAFASMGLGTTVYGADGYSSGSRITQSGSTVTFGNLLDSLVGTNIATLQVAYPSTAGVNLSAPLPGLDTGALGTFTFNRSLSPGGTGASLSGTLTSFVMSDVSAAVPEPAGWATMLAGAGFAGAMLRRRSRGRRVLARG